MATPTQIVGCTAWFDASDTSTLTLSGTTVTRWNDKSGNGYYASNASGIVSSSNTINGVNALNFPAGGAPGLLAIKNSGGASALALGPNMTIFIAAKTAAGSGNGGNFFFCNAAFAVGGGSIYGPNFILYRIGSGAYIVSGIDPTGLTGDLGSGGVYSENNAYFTGTYFNTSVVISVQPQIGTSSLNGTSYSLGGGAQSMLATSYPEYFGAAARGDALAFTLGEVIIYNSSLNLDQRQRVEGYLAWKWGTQASLPLSHPYYAAAPTTMLSCFTADSMILTPTGYKSADTIRTGDIVMTADGRKVPVKAYNATVMATEDTAPFLVKKDTFALGCPTADLRLSPWHAIQTKPGVWMKPMSFSQLYPGSIQQYGLGKPVTYYHFEAPNFFKDNLICDGTIVESYGGDQLLHVKGRVYTYDKNLGGYTRITGKPTQKKLMM